MPEDNIKKALSIELRKANADLELLYSIIEDIAGEIELEKLAIKIVEETKKRLDVEAAILMLLDEEGINLKLVASSDIDLQKEIKIPKDGIIKESLDSLSFQVGRFTIKNNSFDSSLCVPLIIQKKPVGVIIACGKLQDEDFTDWDKRVVYNIALVGGIIQHAIENAKLARKNTCLAQKIKNRFLETISALSATIDAKDPYYTADHSKNVRGYVKQIAKQLQLSKEEKENIELSAVLHDIGKIGTPNELLWKPGKLDNEEFAIVKKHPEKGAEILKNSKSLEDLAPGIKSHHENFDGSGYPDRLKGKKIPLSARIIRVADSYEAIISKRPYQEIKSEEKAIDDLKEKINTWYDPDVVKAFVEALKKGGRKCKTMI